MIQISLPCLHSSFHNAYPRYLKSRRDLLYFIRIESRDTTIGTKAALDENSQSTVTPHAMLGEELRQNRLGVTPAVYA